MARGDGYNPGGDLMFRRKYEEETRLGPEHEENLFGRAARNEKLAARLRVECEKSGYLSYPASFDAIRETYAADAENPSAEFARDLRLELIESLEASNIPVTDASVRFYNALGTPLDIFHGVDAWIEIQIDGYEEPFIVTLDATVRASKRTGGYKADVMIGDIANPNTQGEMYLDQVGEYTDQVLMRLNREIEVRSARRTRQSGGSRTH